jgi:hypothetical protein
LQFPAIPAANVIGARYLSIRPIEKPEGKILVGHIGAANLVVELRRGNLLHAVARKLIELRIVFAQLELQGFGRIGEDVAHNRAALNEMERDDHLILPQLTLQIDLLLRLLHPNGLEDLPGGRRRLSLNRNHTKQRKGDRLAHGKEVLSFKFEVLSEFQSKVGLLKT